MLTLKALLDFTPQQTRQRAIGIGVRIVEAVIDKDDNGIFKRVICKTVGSSIPRTTVFKFYQTKRKEFNIHSPTWVHCSDESFTFWWEVADTARGSSSIINSNGAMPRVRNPMLRPGLCKHAFRAALAALKAEAKTVPGVEEVTKTARKINALERGKTGKTVKSS